MQIRLLLTGFIAVDLEIVPISAYEAMLVGAIPMVPDRLSYTEMYDE